MMSNPLFFPTRRPSISLTRQKKLHMKIKTNQKPHPGRKQCINQDQSKAPPGQEAMYQSRPIKSPTRAGSNVSIKTNKKLHPRQEAMYQLPHFAPPTPPYWGGGGGGVGLDIDSRISQAVRNIQFTCTL